MGEEFSRLDSADYLSVREVAVANLEATLDSADDPSQVIQALGTIARSGDLSELSRRTGMSCEGLCNALSADGDPSFATIVKVADALDD